MDEVKAATLEPCNDAQVIETARRLIGEHHKSLVDAKITYLWAIGKSLKKWGQVRVVTEATWWLSGGLEGGGVDIEIQVNKTLMGKLTEAGRTFVLDHFHSLVRAKDAGQLTMATVEGERKLYTSDKPSLSVHAAVLARNPEGLREIGEVEQLWKALREPAQFLLDLQAQEGEDEEEEDEEPRGAAPAPPPPRDTPPPARPRPVPVQYYQRTVLDIDGEDMPAVLRYSDAANLPSQLNGVHQRPTTDPAKAFEGIVHNGNLTYDEDPVTLKRFRMALEDALEDHKPAPMATAELG
jgi:hypothetical protein